MQDGIEDIIKRIDLQDVHPVLVAIWGSINSGKSTLIHELLNHYGQGNVREIDPRNRTGPEHFEMLRDQSETLRKVILYHCVGLRFDEPERLRDYEDPNLLAQTIVGRQVHVNFLIYNPKEIYEMEEQRRIHRNQNNYDMIIRNPHAVTRRYHK